jgi:hypothetical protein
VTTPGNFKLVDSPLTDVFQHMQDVRELTGQIDRDTILLMKEFLLTSNMEKVYDALERSLTVAMVMGEIDAQDLRHWYQRVEGVFNSVKVPGIDGDVDRFNVSDEVLQDFGPIATPENILRDAGLLTIESDNVSFVDAIVANVRKK